MPSVPVFAGIVTFLAFATSDVWFTTYTRMYDAIRRVYDQWLTGLYPPEKEASQGTRHSESDFEQMSNAPRTSAAGNVFVQIQGTAAVESGLHHRGRTRLLIQSRLQLQSRLISDLSVQ
jgi:hypothetical protein